MNHMNNFQKFIAVSRYARWLDDKNRRETWQETVDRYWDYMTAQFPDLLEVPDIKDAIYNLEVMPSMRLLMTAGPACDRDNTCGYNCSYMAIEGLESFYELMFILMNGTGTGFSVELGYVSELPTVPSEMVRSEDKVIVVEDSKEGWSLAFKELLSSLYEGIHPTWDISKIRPAGARLKTFGGRASGPGPLEDVFRFTTNLAYKAKGRKLTTSECHDLCCVIARSVIVGGVRRAAMLSLSDLNDTTMARAKTGTWWEVAPHRALANNSAVYDGRPSLGSFLREWSDLYDSHAGERGIFNRAGAYAHAEKSGRELYKFGLNPCAEILLRSKQFCNLTEVVIDSEDKVSDIKRKVEYATILGTCQAAMTFFPFLSEGWKKNCEEERLLGVSMTGIYDNPLMWGKGGLGKLAHRLERWKAHSHKVNMEWADKIGINPAAAITCVKPSGTVSCLCDTASGIHPRYAEQFIRRVRIDKKDPLYMLMKDQGVPVEDCVMNPESTAVFSFPMSAPKGSKTTQDVTSLEHLELWRVYKKHWTDHNPSITVSYTDDEFLDIGRWVWENFDDVQGISFLPKVEHIYKQAPFEEVSKEQVIEAEKNQPEIDFSELHVYELKDTTVGSQTLACSGNSCELVDLTQE